MVSSDRRGHRRPDLASSITNGFRSIFSPQESKPLLVGSTNEEYSSPSDDHLDSNIGGLRPVGDFRHVSYQDHIGSSETSPIDRHPPSARSGGTSGGYSGKSPQHARWSAGLSSASTLRGDDPDGNRSPDREGGSGMYDSDADYVDVGEIWVPVYHNSVWLSIFWVFLAATIAASLMVFFNTDPPDRKHPIGDTIYNTIHHSFKFLTVSTLISIVVAVGWLALLRRHVRWTAQAVILSVPVILLGFFIYAFAWSFSSDRPEQNFQNQILRLVSFVPLVIAGIWIAVLARAWTSAGRSVQILEFALQRLDQYRLLIGVGIAVMIASVAWTGLWLVMFARVFLGGHFSFSQRLFLIDVSTWWLAGFYVFVYMWASGVLSGIQRAITVSTISYWYFYRNVRPQPTPDETVLMPLYNEADIQYGTIAFSAFLDIVVRLPMMILPRRLAAVLMYIMRLIVPTNVSMLTSRLTLTHAAIHCCSLGTAARDIVGLKGAIPTVIETGHGNMPSPVPDMTPYKLAKLLLHGVRYVMSISTGFVAWVFASHDLIADVPPVTVVKGSMYAYVVAVVAASIGWYTLAAMEDVVGCIIDALLLCWAYDVTANPANVRACPEADKLFEDKSGAASVGSDPAEDDADGYDDDDEFSEDDHHRRRRQKQSQGLGPDLESGTLARGTKVL